MHRDVKWKVLRLSRRETLKGLGALAFGANAVAAAACSSDEGPNTPLDPGGSAGAAPASPGTPATSGAATGAATGTAGSTSSAAGTGSGGSPAAGSGGAGTGTSAAGTSAAGTGAAGSPPAAGAPAAGSGGVSGAPSTGGVPAAGGGAAGAPASGMATDIASLQCIATPAMTDGPFFVDNQMQRSNLTMGETTDAITKAVPLKLVIGVFKVNGMMCMPLSGVHVDIWHADSQGIYSSVTPGAVQSVDTRGKTFLRGWQATDESGLATFETIWPGWYMSRTIHIHFKLRMLSSGSTASFTSQMFFDEQINSAVLAKPPYAMHSGRSVLNDDDHIYNGTAANGQKPAGGAAAPGKSIMPTVVEQGPGYVATLKVGLKMV